MAITTGKPHILVADPPKAIVPGGSEGWGALLARQAPRATSSSGQAGSLEPGTPTSPGRTEMDQPPEEEDHRHDAMFRLFEHYGQCRG
jgi:hypothetical protein